MKKLLDTMKELFAGCRAILDVGIGTGRLAEYFNDSGFNIVGVDVSLSMMAKAREKRLRDLVQADAHHLPFRDRVFDGAIMIHVLHLVRDWVQVVGEVGRVTRKVIVAEVEGGEGFSPRQKGPDPSCRTPEQVADRLFDEACRVLLAFSCHLARA